MHHPKQSQNARLHESWVMRDEIRDILDVLKVDFALKVDVLWEQSIRNTIVDREHPDKGAILCFVIAVVDFPNIDISGRQVEPLIGSEEALFFAVFNLRDYIRDGIQQANALILWDILRESGAHLPADFPLFWNPFNEVLPCFIGDDFDARD